MKKVLIIRFSSIGDIVLTTPIIRCVKQQMDDVEIHYLTKKSFAGLLINNPYISKVHCLETNLNDTIDILQKENFDCIIDLHKNIRTFRVKMKLKVPSFTFNKLNVEKWLLVKLKINILPKIHIVDRYFKAV
ncbi:MAG: glycosyl transferase, partial [Bacteroidota bacterium]